MKLRVLKWKRKSSAKLFPYSIASEVLRDAVFLVEASHEEMFLLWREYHHQPPPGEVHVVDWKDISYGDMIQVGETDGRPTCVEIWYALIMGKKVAFYEGCSQLVDYKLIEDWLSLCKRNGHHWGHCNAANFQQALDAVGALDEYRKEWNKKNV